MTDDTETEIDDDRLEEAAAWFMRMRDGAARAENFTGLQNWLGTDARNLVAYRQVLASMNVVGEYANVPEMVVIRRNALDESRKASEERLSRLRSRASGLAGLLRHKGLQAAIVASLVVLVCAGWWLTASRASVYETERGEQKTQLLSDGSSIALDADSRVQVRYSDGVRDVTLERGQARFTVARDVVRPFRVHARGQTVVALGTQFDVDLIAHSVRVVLIEGHVTVAGVSQNRNERGSAPEPVQMQAGQVLRVRDDGSASRLASIDLARATAWNAGKLFFDNEPLASAVERINRYSREEIVVDPGVANVAITGVFNAGDTNAFIDAVTNYFDVDATRDRVGKLRLTGR